MKVSKSVLLYDLESFKFGTKEPKPEKDGTAEQRSSRIMEHFAKRGMRRSVEAVLLVHRHSHPHILLLRQGTAEAPVFRLPGGRLRVGEGETEGIRRKLTNKLGKPGSEAAQWQISQLLGIWWRPNFDSPLYPYLPAHISQPKECVKIFLVELEDAHVLAVPKNSTLLAVPLFDVYGNATRYGSVIASIPSSVSRFSFSYQ